MSQGEVLKAIKELGFTSFEELKEELDFLTTPSLSHSLTALSKWDEIITIDFGVRKVYFSEEFWEEIHLQNE